MASRRADFGRRLTISGQTRRLSAGSRRIRKVTRWLEPAPDQVSAVNPPWFARLKVLTGQIRGPHGRVKVMSELLLQSAEKRGLTLPPLPHTSEALGELAAELFLRPLRSARRMPREESYVSNARRRMLPTAAGDVAVWEWGPPQGKLVGLVHGWDGHGAQLGAFAAPLAAAGFSVLSLDGPGHGDSFGTEAHVPLLARVLVGIEAEVGPFHALVGHSMGAAGAATATTLGSRLHGLVMLAPPLSQRDRVERLSSRLELAPAVRQGFFDAVERRTATSYADADLMAVARHSPCPLLVFHDPADPETSYADSEQIVAGWRGARLVPCPGRGHYRIISTPEVVRHTVEFVAGLEPWPVRRADPTWQTPRPALRPSKTTA